MPTKTVLVLGATGKTGQRVVEQLLSKDSCIVRAIVRSKERLSDAIIHNPSCEVIEANILDLDIEQLSKYTKGCDAIAQCLGHGSDRKAVFGEPKFLCRDALTNVCQAIEINKPTSKVKFVLMNSAMVEAQDGSDGPPTLDRRLLRYIALKLLPPHLDNIQTAQYLNNTVGNNNDYIEWVCVRPSALHEGEVNGFDVKPNITENLFREKPTARATCAHFMTSLIYDQPLFNQWKFKWPNVFDKE